MDKSENILVTGGAGYIGSHACKALAHAGFTPITYDNLERGHRWAVKWGPLEVGDIKDQYRLDEVLEKYRPQAVLHFAAYAYVGESVVNPTMYYRNNVVGSHILLESMREHGMQHMVFSSSCATYGMPECVPMTEAHPQRPINPYGSSKLMIERMLQDFSFAYGLRSVSLRYFNAAGADPEGEIGEVHDPEPHLIPRILQVAAGRLPYIDVYGDDYDTLDGTCIRDYAHVTDLAEAHVLALRWLLDGGETRSFNLGSGKGFSVKHVIEAARRITCHDIPVRVIERRPGDPPALVADNARARGDLGWLPDRGSIAAQLADAWNWMISRERG